MKTKSLIECELNKDYQIAEVQIDNQKLLKYLANLFIKKGERIMILRRSYKNKSFMVKALGINYAIDKSICEKILVYDV